MYHNGEWGAVCDRYNWDLQDAMVVCRQLGFGPAISARFKEFFSWDGYRVWLSTLRCFGTEETIERCTRSTWGSHNCNQYRNSYGAAVKCSLPGT